MKLRPLISGALVVSLLLAATIGFAWAIGAEYDDAPEANHTVTNEQLTADVGNYTRVDAPDHALSFYDNETVTNSSGGTLQEGSDYEWNASDRTIYFYNSSTHVSDGEQVEIDYAYTSKIETARGLKTILGIPIRYVYPFGILVALAVSIGGVAVALVKWFSPGSGSSSLNRNFGR
jgi:hypothetical protein